MNLDLEKSGLDTLKKLEILKSLSGTWYDMGYPSIAGSYAEDIAVIQKPNHHGPWREPHMLFV